VCVCVYALFGDGEKRPHGFGGVTKTTEGS